MKNTAIEWCHHTVNFWWGCVFARLANGQIRQECINCYARLIAEVLNFSQGKATWGEAGKRWGRAGKAVAELVRLDRAAGKRGVRERVFINSMSDTFEDREDLNHARALLWAVAVQVKNLDLLLLTKRPQNVLRMVPQEWLASWPAHVWVGGTAGTQAAADETVGELLKIPARVRFLSMEPLLESVSITSAVYAASRLAETEGWGIHWIIVGGESGQKARTMYESWATSIREQCASYGVPFFFKQWGEWSPEPPPGKARLGMFKLGKKKAGRLLAGQEWNEVPTPALTRPA